MPRKAKKMPEATKAGVTAIPLKWGSPDDAPTIYANNMLVSKALGEFYLFFCETVPPLALAGDKLPDFIVAKPKVKIVISAENMPRFVKALNTVVGLDEGKKK